MDFVLSKNIPAIVFTGKFDDNIRNNILFRKIVDYVLKRDPHSLDYIISLIRRIKRNQSIKVLVADDSSIARKNICGLLKVHQYKVFEACDGNDACRILDEHLIAECKNKNKSSCPLSLFYSYILTTM